MRAALIWAGLALLMAVPVVASLFSPLLAWRSGIYISAGLAGVLGMALILLQPLLASGDLPGLGLARSRRIHRIIGALLVGSVVVHVGGLWLTSPPDVIDALTFTSPTPFSVWGVIAMWGLLASAVLVALRTRLMLRPMTWRRLHVALAAIIAVGTVIHALRIDGTMELMSKTALAVAILAALMWVVWRKGLLTPRKPVRDREGA